jgi:hypothetical protein
MWARVVVLQSLGKPGRIVHINAMSEEHDNQSRERANPTPQYRVRTPEGETGTPKPAQNAAPKAAVVKPADSGKPKEIGGPKGLEPTRFGDWERDGRCVDF